MVDEPRPKYRKGDWVNVPGAGDFRILAIRESGFWHPGAVWSERWVYRLRSYPGGPNSEFTESGLRPPRLHTARMGQESAYGSKVPEVPEW